MRLPYRGAPRCEHVFSNMSRLGFVHSRHDRAGIGPDECFKSFHGDVLFNRGSASEPSMDVGALRRPPAAPPGGAPGSARWLPGTA